MAPATASAAGGVADTAPGSAAEDEVLAELAKLGEMQQRIDRSNERLRGAGAAMGWPAPAVEAPSGDFSVQRDWPSAVDPGQKRVSAAGYAAGVVGPPSCPACADVLRRSVQIAPTVDKPPTHRASLWIASARCVPVTTAPRQPPTA